MVSRYNHTSIMRTNNITNIRSPWGQMEVPPIRVGAAVQRGHLSYHLTIIHAHALDIAPVHDLDDDLDLDLIRDVDHPPDDAAGDLRPEVIAGAGHHLEEGEEPDHGHHTGVTDRDPAAVVEAAEDTGILEASQGHRQRRNQTCIGAL